MVGDGITCRMSQTKKKGELQNGLEFKSVVVDILDTLKGHAKRLMNDDSEMS